MFRVQDTTRRVSDQTLLLFFPETAMSARKIQDMHLADAPRRDATRKRASASQRCCKHLDARTRMPSRAGSRRCPRVSLKSGRTMGQGSKGEKKKSCLVPSVWFGPSIHSTFVPMCCSLSRGRALKHIRRPLQPIFWPPAWRSDVSTTPVGWKTRCRDLVVGGWVSYPSHSLYHSI